MFGIIELAIPSAPLLPFGGIPAFLALLPRYLKRLLAFLQDLEDLSVNLWFEMLTSTTGSQINNFFYPLFSLSCSVDQQ
jgi:hypothetical protein